MSKAIDEDTRRIGFREAMFTDHGFSLNGKIIKLHGLDRHQTFPCRWARRCLPARNGRTRRSSARTATATLCARRTFISRSRHFLDACDDLGLLVLEEIPGWQRIGDLAWQDIVGGQRAPHGAPRLEPPFRIILWGVRISLKAPTIHDFYTRTNNLARALDATRQTCSIRTGGNYGSEFLGRRFHLQRL